MSQNHEIIIKSVTDLTECVEETLDEGETFSEEECNSYIDTLVEKNLLRSALHEDSRLYVLNEHIPQSVGESQLTRIELLIMRQFYKNAKATFIVYNTQKGKTAILIKQIRQIKQAIKSKPVFYIAVSNDKTLADQSSDSIRIAIEDCDCEVFTLSSSTKTTFEDLKTKIDAYIADEDYEYKTPVIVALANNSQLDKIMKLMAHVQYKNIRNSYVKNVVMFDEADETYPRIRDKTIRYKDKNESFLGMIDKENRSLEAVYWISATEGELLEGRYAECENAANYVCDEEELSCPNYRAMHHPSTQYKIKKQLTRESKNGYAIRNIDENDDHFQTPITLPSGEIYFRKTIINSSSKRSEMVDLATSLRNRAKGWHAMIFNQTGLTVLKHGDPVTKIIKTKGHRFNKLLFETYKKYNLHDKPLAIMGNKKVNRGISFHYAPPLPLGGEGLIWTDIILGDISDKDQAAQKAGRGGGKISHCPQYPENEIYYWTTEKTFTSICTHNSRIDNINNNVSGCNIGDAFKSASQKIKEFKVMHTVEPSKYRVYKYDKDVEEVVKKICKKDYHFQDPDPSTGFIKTSLNGPSDVADLFKAIGKVNTGYTGLRDTSSGGRTVYPCYLDTNDPATILYVVLIDNLLANEEQKRLIEEYGQNIEIPQIDNTGNLIENLKQSIFNI
jgi:hypothetical protein